MAQMTVAEAIESYIAKRDELRQLQHEFNEKEAKLKTDLEVISSWLRDKADELSVDNFKTKFGTAYRSTKKFYRISDWDVFVGWVKETDNFQCIEKRVAKRATTEVHESDGLPPGLEYFEQVEFLVNRAKG